MSVAHAAPKPCVSGAALAALAFGSLLACGACGKKDRAAEPGDAGQGDAGRRYAARDGGALQPCATAADCAVRGGDRVCKFPRPGIESPTGVCGVADPTCVVSYPYCAADNRTIWACTFPTQPWLRKGVCEDAAVR